MRDTPTLIQPARTSRKLRVGAWCRSLDFEKAMRGETEQLAEAVFSVVPRAPARNPSPALLADDSDVLIIDVDLGDADEYVLLSRIVELRGSRRPVIATAPDAAMNDVRRLMRLGVSDFLPQPVSRAEIEHSLKSVISRLAQDDPAAKRGAVATFMRPTGGAGATTLATHFAFALASKQPPRKIAVVDLDLQRGAAGLHLDLRADVGVVSCLERYPDIDPGLIDSVASKHGAGIDVFLATPNRWPLDDYAPEAIGQLLEVMRGVYDWVVVDAPPVWTRWHRALLERTDIAVVVLQKTVADLRLARGQLDALREFDLHPNQIVTVCNRVQQGWFGRDISKSEVELALGRPVDCAVPSDYALVSEAINLGVPTSRIKAGSKFEKATVALADEIERRLTLGRLDAPKAVVPQSTQATSPGEGLRNESRRAVVSAQSA